MRVDFTISDGQRRRKIQVDVVKGTSLLEASKLLPEVKIASNRELGEWITEMDGKKEQEGFGYQFYINGGLPFIKEGDEPTFLRADNILLDKDTEVEWKYEYATEEIAVGGCKGRIIQPKEEIYVSVSDLLAYSTPEPDVHIPLVIYDSYNTTTEVPTCHINYSHDNTTETEVEYIQKGESVEKITWEVKEGAKIMKKIELIVPQELKEEKEPTVMRQVKSKLALRSYARQIELVEKYSPNPREIIDVGCGAGLPSFFLKQKFKHAKVTGVEIKEWDVWKKLRKYGVDFEKFDGKRLPFPDKSCDVIVAWGVLEHVGENGVNEKEFIKELKRVLRNGGKIYIFNLPTQDSWKENLASLLGFNYHKRRFSKKEIMDLLSPELKIEYLEPQGFMPAGMGKMEKISPILNALAFIDEHVPKSRWHQCWNIIASTSF